MTRILTLIFLLSCFSGNAQTFQELNDQFITLYENGEYEAAVPVGIKAIAQAKKEFGEVSQQYAVSMQNVGEAYFSLKDYDKATPFYRSAEKAFSLFLKTSQNSNSAACNLYIGEIHFFKERFDSAEVYYNKAFRFYLSHPKEEYENIILTMNYFTDLLLPLAKYNEAKTVYQKVLPIIEQNEGTSNANFIVTITNLASAHYHLQEYDVAEKYILRGLPVAEKMNGLNNAGYTDMLDILGNAVRELGRLKEAESINLQSLKLKQNFEVQDTVALVTSYGGLANVYGDMADFKKAFDYYNQALRLLQLAGLHQAEDFIVLKRSMAYTYILAGNLINAKSVLHEVLELQTKMFGKSYVINGEVLISIANAEAQLNELSAAEAHATEGLSLISNFYGDEHYAVAKAKEVLGLVYHKLGNSSKGIAMFKDAVALNTKLFTEQSKHTASVLSNMGLLYQELGNFAEAEIALERSLKIREKLYGKDHPDYALSLCNLAMIYVYQARYVQADKMLADALNIFIRKDLAQSNNFISILNNIAFMAERQGNLAEAKKLYLRLLQMLEARPDKNVGALYLILNNLSAVSLQDESYKDAVTYSQKAMEYAKHNQGIRSLEYIKSANNSVVAYRKTGDNANARKQMDALIPLCKDVFGSDAQMLGILYFNYAMLEGGEGKFEKAGEYLDKALSIYLNGFRQNFYTLSEKEKLTWWQDQSFHFAMFPSLLTTYHQTNGALVSAMVNHQLQLKGFVLNDASAALRKARASANAGLKKLVDQWQLNKTLLSKQLSLPVEERTYSVDSLELIANNLEKNINQQAAGLINLQPEKNGNWQSVQASLKQGEAAVEFMRYPLYRNSNYTDTIQYAAIIITKEKATPEFVTLGNEKQIEWCLTGGKEDTKEIRINNLYRATLGKKNTTFAGDSLYSLVWKPLMPHLKNVTTVLYAPDGLLHKVAFQALPTTTNKLLIDTLQLQQYTSIRQVAAKDGTSEKWTSAFVLGNADFNNSASTTIADNTVNVTFSASRSANAAWSPLPGTEKEINIIQPLFTTKGLKVTAANGARATEEIFKSLNSKSPSIIHLATHGFFLPDPEIKTTTQTTSANTYALSDEPLMRSGIIMAGANKPWSGEKITKGEDGIVTAYEIAQLNLSNTRLVVLSACETALGDLKGSEGVFGLQRAFKIAGVKNLVVSLWQVPDKETAELMTLFYNHLLSGITAREAFYKAQKEMRSKYPPFSWAAFVLVE